MVDVPAEDCKRYSDCGQGDEQQVFSMTASADSAVIARFDSNIRQDFLFFFDWLLKRVDLQSLSLRIELFLLGVLGEKRVGGAEEV